MMKAIQISLDEKMLKELDRQPEAQARGRSAFVRAAIAELLRRRREAALDAQYRAAYTGARTPSELEGWEGEQVWPEK